MKRYYRITELSRIFYETKNCYQSFDQALANRDLKSTTLLIYDEHKNLLKAIDIKTELEDLKIRSNEHWGDIGIKIAGEQIKWQNGVQKHNKFCQRLTQQLRHRLENQ